jgi:hypothetical protein
MNYHDDIGDYGFVGQEFLTWLWFKSEQRGGAVTLAEAGDIAITFEKHMVLEYGVDDYHERVICSGLNTQLNEARTALRHGKKLEQARIKLSQFNTEYIFTFAARTFGFKNIVLPRSTQPETLMGPDGTGTEGQELNDRIEAIETVVRLFYELFSLFCTVRTSAGWDEELRAIRRWVHGAAERV